MNQNFEAARQLIRGAKDALKHNNRLVARNLAREAYKLDSRNLDALLILGGLSNPHESVEFLKKALELCPTDPRAREGMHWAIQRLRKSREGRALSNTQPVSIRDQVKLQPYPKSFMQIKRHPVWIYPILVGLIVVSVLIGTGFLPSEFVEAREIHSIAQVFDIFKPTQTPTSTSTPTLTPTPTSTSGNNCW